MAMSRAEYWLADNGLWYFRRIAGNGKNSDPSQGYKDKSTGSVRKAIQRRWPGIKMKRVSA